MSRYACAIYNQIHTTLGRTSRKEFSILFLCVIETKTTAASLFFTSLLQLYSTAYKNHSCHPHLQNLPNFYNVESISTTSLLSLPETSIAPYAFALRLNLFQSMQILIGQVRHSSLGRDQSVL